MVSTPELDKLKSFIERICAHTVSGNGDVDTTSGFCRIYAGKSRARRGKAVVSGIKFETDGDSVGLFNQMRREIDQIDGPGKIWIEAMVTGDASSGPFATLTLMNEASDSDLTEPWEGSAQENTSRALVEMTRLAFGFAERAQDARFALPQGFADMAHQLGVYEGAGNAHQLNQGQERLADVMQTLGASLGPAATIFATGYAAERGNRAKESAARETVKPLADGVTPDHAWCTGEMERILSELRSFAGIPEGKAFMLENKNMLIAEVVSACQ